MGKRKQAQKKWSRLEQKIEKRKEQQKELQIEIEKIRKKQHEQQILILDECEARAIDDRVAYYDQFRVNKKLPRVILDSSQVLPSQINLLELLPLNSDVFRHIVAHLAPREYESFSLTCKSFSELLFSANFISNYLNSFINYVISNGTTYDINLLEEKRAVLEPRGMLRILKFVMKRFINLEMPVKRICPNDRIRPPLLYFGEEKTYFYDSKTGEFGEVMNELLFSVNSWKKRMSHKDFQKKYNFVPSRNLMTGADIDALQIKPISELKHLYGFIDLCMVDYNSQENYYKLITTPLNSVHLFSVADKRFDPYIDWIATRDFFQQLGFRNKLFFS